jgi:ketosteroid isomerase-like protein
MLRSDMPNISPDQVRAEVKKFWNALVRKSKEDVEEMYFPAATVFSSTVPRTEPARLTVTRRARQFFASKSTMNVDVGAIDVQLAGTLAIASYNFSFQGTQVKTDGSSVNHEIPAGRGTHVFQLDESGKLRILHEHFSSGEIAKGENSVEI